MLTEVGSVSGGFVLAFVLRQPEGQAAPAVAVSALFALEAGLVAGAGAAALLAGGALAGIAGSTTLRYLLARARR